MIDREILIREERVRIMLRQFSTYATMMRRFALLGGDPAVMREHAEAAARCLDSAGSELRLAIGQELDAVIPAPATTVAPPAKKPGIPERLGMTPAELRNVINADTISAPNPKE